MLTPGFPWNSQGRDVCELDWHCLKRLRVCLQGGRWFCETILGLKQRKVMFLFEEDLSPGRELSGWVCCRHNEVWLLGSSSGTPCCSEWNSNLLSSPFPFFPYREPVLWRFTNPRRVVVPKRTLAERLLSRRPPMSPSGRTFPRASESNHQIPDSWKQIILTKFTIHAKTELWTLCCEAWIIPKCLRAAGTEISSLGSKFPED